MTGDLFDDLFEVHAPAEIERYLRNVARTLGGPLQLFSMHYHKLAEEGVDIVALQSEGAIMLLPRLSVSPSTWIPRA